MWGMWDTGIQPGPDLIILWWQGRHLLLTTEILCFWELVRKNVTFIAQIQCYVKCHSPQPKYFVEKTHSSISSSDNACLPLGQQHPGTAAPSKSSHLSARTRDICLQILPFTSSGCRRFHSMTAPNTFSQGRWNFQGIQGDMTARGSGQEVPPLAV